MNCPKCNRSCKPVGNDFYSCAYCTNQWYDRTIVIAMQTTSQAPERAPEEFPGAAAGIDSAPVINALEQVKRHIKQQYNKRKSMLVNYQNVDPGLVAYEDVFHKVNDIIKKVKGE